MTAAFVMQLSMRQIQLLGALLDHDADDLLEQRNTITTARALERRGFLTRDESGWCLTWTGELLAQLLDAIRTSESHRAMNRILRKADQ